MEKCTFPNKKHFYINITEFLPTVLNIMSFKGYVSFIKSIFNLTSIFPLYLEISAGKPSK